MICIIQRPFNFIELAVILLSQAQAEMLGKSGVWWYTDSVSQFRRFRYGFFAASRGGTLRSAGHVFLGSDLFRLGDRVHGGGAADLLVR